MVKLRDGKFRGVMPEAATGVASEVATRLQGAEVTSVDGPEREVAE